jgi:hypothetical protein
MVNKLAKKQDIDIKNDADDSDDVDERSDPNSPIRRKIKE